MSGHSKWATIKRQKGANDQKRGQLFTKLLNAISIAVREGGGVTDPENNFRLRLAVETARSANMPKDNIDRAIQRALGKQENNVEEAIYEGFGPGGFSVIVEAVTDNKQRTFSEIKNIFTKNNGNIGAQGSVMHQFIKKGIVTVDKNGKSLDDIFLMAAELGADDVEDIGNEVLIYTKPEDLAKVRNSFAKQQVTVKGAELTLEPLITTPIAEKDTAEKALNFLDKLESLDDVQKVYANFDIPESVLQQHQVNE